MKVFFLTKINHKIGCINHNNEREKRDASFYFERSADGSGGGGISEGSGFVGL